MEYIDKYEALQNSLSQLRQGMFSHENKGRTDLTATDEGVPLSMTLLSRGYIAEQELLHFSARRLFQAERDFAR